MINTNPKPVTAEDFRTVASNDMTAARRFLSNASAQLERYADTMSTADFASSSAAVAVGFLSLAALGLQQADRLDDAAIGVSLDEAVGHLDEVAGLLAAVRRREEQAAEEARPHDDELVHTPGPDPDGKCPACRALDGDEPRHAVDEGVVSVVADVNGPIHAAATLQLAQRWADENRDEYEGLSVTALEVDRG